MKFKKLITTGKFLHFRSAIDMSRSRTRRIEFFIFTFVKNVFRFNLRKNLSVHKKSISCVTTNLPSNCIFAYTLIQKKLFYYSIPLFTSRLFIQDHQTHIFIIKKCSNSPERTDRFM